MQRTKKEGKNSSTHSRRDFMQQIALCYVAAYLPLSFSGCANNETMYKGSGKVPYKTWEEMLMALQTCPDYLEGRMKQLIASKDVEAMFQFVRDEIYLMPTANKAIGQIGNQYKWGLKGILRYGMATPREKAELLNQMLIEAGFTSKVVYERTDIQPEEAMQFFFRPIHRKFDMQVSKKQWRQWQQDLQIDASDFQIPILDPNFEKTKALAERLWEHVPKKESLKLNDFDFRWDNYRTPTVQFEKEGTVFYAHLFDSEVPFGKLRNKGTLKEADAIKLNEDTVELKITYREAIHPEKELELISGAWNACDLVGSQVHFANLNGVSIAQSVATPISSLRLFTPSLAYQNFDATLEEIQARSFIAAPFTLEGKKIILPENNTNTTAPIVLHASSQKLLKTVDQVALKAIPIHKPLVKLQVRPTDSEGKIVKGLQANNFNFSDNNHPIQVLMESNRQTPKILVLYDASGSMPKDYYKENMDEFVATLKQNIQSNFPAAIVDQWATPSELYTWLLKASKTDYDLIIFATDGQNEDTYNVQDLAAYQNGPPALILNVNDNDAPHYKMTFDQMASITNGLVFHAKDQNVVLEKIVDFINKMDIAPYTFTYYSNHEVKHEVVLTMDKERLRDRANFEFLTDNNPEGINQGIIGMYLDIQVGNTHTKRVLAGWDPVTQLKQKPSKVDFLDVKSLLLGGMTLYFEGEGPTLATRLVDVLKYKLSTRSWGEALLEDDIETAKTEVENGVFLYDSLASSLMAPLDERVTESSFTFASGMRVGIYRQKFLIEAKKRVASFDFLPTSKYVSFVKGDGNAFQINLQKTAQLAIREGAFFANSTFSDLNDATWIERTQAIAQNWFKDLDVKDKDYRYWQERLYRGDGHIKIFDASQVRKAFWQLNSQGELYGILRDGTGGGANSIEIQLKELNRVMDLYMAIFAAMGVTNLAIGIVAAYSKTLVKLYAIVTEVIIVLDASEMEDKVKAALLELACNIDKEIIFFALGSVGEILGNLDLLISLFGGGGLPGLTCG